MLNLWYYVWIPLLVKKPTPIKILVFFTNGKSDVDFVYDL